MVTNGARLLRCSLRWKNKDVKVGRIQNLLSKNKKQMSIVLNITTPAVYKTVCCFIKVPSLGWGGSYLSDTDLSIYL